MIISDAPQSKGKGSVLISIYWVLASLEKKNYPKILQGKSNRHANKEGVIPTRIGYLFPEIASCNSVTYEP